jgi:hypothetical protein
MLAPYCAVNGTCVAERAPDTASLAGNSPDRPPGRGRSRRPARRRGKTAPILDRLNHIDARSGEDRAGFPAPGTLLAETGLAPVTRASGRTRQVRFRYAVNRGMRHAINSWMFVAIHEDN